MTQDREKYERQALQDHAQHVGKVLMVRELTGYRGSSDDPEDFVFDPPLAVRLLPSQPKEILHWVDEWLDPYWDVKIVDTGHPDLPAEGLQAPWMFGVSYNSVNGKSDAGFSVETWPEWRSRLWKSMCRWLS